MNEKLRGFKGGWQTIYLAEIICSQLRLSLNAGDFDPQPISTAVTYILGTG